METALSPSNLIDERIRKLLLNREVSQADLERATTLAEDRIVYFVQCGVGGPIKIGTSRRSKMPGRLTALQTGSAYPLRITRTFPGSPRLEKILHWVFREARMEGEWFWPIDSLCDVAHATRPPEDVAIAA